MRFSIRVITLTICVFLFGRVWIADVGDSMKITLLGTGTPYPDADRFGSAVLVEGGGRKLLFDCGRGVVTRLSEAGVNPNDIDSLFLTHPYCDHVLGIPGPPLTRLV